MTTATVWEPLPDVYDGETLYVGKNGSYLEMGGEGITLPPHLRLCRLVEVDTPVGSDNAAGADEFDDGDLEFDDDYLDDGPERERRPMSRARRAQLDRRGAQRPERSRLGSYAYVESEAVRKTTRYGNYSPSVDELCVVLREMAMGGVMPSVGTFDRGRPAHWTGAMSHIRRLGMTWNELAAAAGLKPNPSRHGD